jgi:hypothetical protein
MSSQKKTRNAKPAGYEQDDDCWIDFEYGRPSLKTLSARIAAFRENPNRRSARVTQREIARELRKHDHADWPPDIVVYLLDLLEGRLPRPRGRGPMTKEELDGYAFIRDEYHDLMDELGAMDATARNVWSQAKAIDPGTIGDMAIEAVRREYCPHIGRERLRNIFSEIAASKT